MRGMSLRALITGIDGFTGRYLSAELVNAGHEVFGLTPFANPSAKNIVQCDICDSSAVKAAVCRINPDLVFHLAAIAFVPHGDVQTIYRTNIVGTRNLLAGLAECAPRPIGVLLVSSANVYGNATEGVIDESTRPAPANDYAVSKLAMEYMASLWSTRLPITIVRTFNYTGVGQSTEFLLPKIVSHFKHRTPVLELGNLDVVRDFSDVRTVANIYRRLLEANSKGNTYNVCSGRGYSIQQVLKLANELTGFTPDVRVNPAFVRESEVRALVGDKHALENVIGPVTVVPLRETLAWMLAP